MRGPSQSFGTGPPEDRGGIFWACQAGEWENGTGLGSPRSTRPLAVQTSAHPNPQEEGRVFFLLR